MTTKFDPDPSMSEPDEGSTFQFKAAPETEEEQAFIREAIMSVQRRFAEVDPSKVRGFIIGIAFESDDGDPDAVDSSCECAGLPGVRRALTGALNSLLGKTMTKEREHEEKEQ